MKNLLTVDIDSALTKLSLGRLKSEDHVPLAVVRAFAGLNPSRIRAKITKRGFVIDHNAQGLDGEVFSVLCSLLDQNLSSELRHAALGRIEALGQLDLLVAFCSGAKKVTWSCGSQKKKLVFKNGKSEFLPAPGQKSDRIEWFGPCKRWDRQARQLNRFLRFAPYDVELNGKNISGGQHLPGALLQVSFTAGGVFGTIGLPRFGLASCTYIVIDGVVDREIWQSPDSGAVWEAVVFCRQGQHAAALSTVHSGFGSLYRLCIKEYPRLAEQSKARVKEILFRIANCNLEISALSKIPMFRTVSKRLLSIEEIITLGQKPGGIEAISDEASVADFVAGDDVLVLDDLDRNFLEKHLGLAIRQAQRAPSKVISFASMLQPVVGAWSEIKRSIASWRSIKILKTSDLDRDEKTLLLKLQWLMDEAYWHGHKGDMVAFCTGTGPAWRWVREDKQNRMTLVLRKNHPKVKKMLTALNARHEALLPIVMMLADGDDVFGSHGEDKLRALVRHTLEY